MRDHQTPLWHAVFTGLIAFAVLVVMPLPVVQGFTTLIGQGDFLDNNRNAG